MDWFPYDRDPRHERAIYFPVFRDRSAPFFTISNVIKSFSNYFENRCKGKEITVEH